MTHKEIMQHAQQAQTLQAQARFNPILVRLQLSAETGLELLDKRFNPILVRLQPVVYEGDEFQIVLFQSHLGSITTFRPHLRSPHFSAVSIPSWFDYNPPLPRLPSLPAPVSIPSWFDYNHAF